MSTISQVLPCRRLSSGLGLAAGADERQLRIEFPRHAIGFQSPIALIINVRIARATDDIMSCKSFQRGINGAELLITFELFMEMPRSLRLNWFKRSRWFSMTSMRRDVVCLRP